ncbi:MAG: phosphotransferase [Chthonomonadales bacterium]|nr:phosphotransferase [Chthonomonadales bacterium]
MTGEDPSASARRRDRDRAARVVVEYPTAQAGRIASRFALPTPIEAFDFAEKGNINQHTFLILAGPPGARREYLLQRINQQVFTRPRSVMASMIACMRAQRDSLARGLLPAGESWEVIELIPTHEGEPYLALTDRRGANVWRLMVKIPEARTYKRLSDAGCHEARLALAEQAGRGLAVYGDLTAGMDTAGLESPLPGYRDTRVYYDQLASVLAGSRGPEQAERWLPQDPVVRESTQRHFLVHLKPRAYRCRVGDLDLRRFIDLALENEEFAMTLLREMEAARIRTVAIHGDTKLDNFLFGADTGRVKALVDLDTIMPHTWLADWGDMVRSLVNVAGEKEEDLSRVRVDLEIFRAVARGFLGTARAITDAEVERMVDAVQIIALELGVRFLSDYLRGDSYFELGPADPPDLNRTRARVQLSLFEQLRNHQDEMKAYIAGLRAAR